MRYLCTQPWVSKLAQVDLLSQNFITETKEVNQWRFLIEL